MLDEFGIETTPVVGPGRQIVEWMQERGVTELVHSTSFPGAWPPSARGSKLGLLRRYVECVLRFRTELMRIVRERNVDIIVAAMAFSWISATRVARALGVPIVWRAGGTECSPIERMILGAWAHWNRPDYLICNGRSVARMFGALIGAPTTVIRNGLDHAQFYPGAASPNLLRSPRARTVVGFAGRLVPQKRPEDFIAAASRFAGRDDVSFLFAGDGSQREHYIDLVRSSGAPIDAVGFVRDIRAFYAACDVFVLPSRSEGCPNVVLEAMAMGAAVVAADAPATREIVTHGHDGLLYPIGDVEALVGQLGVLIDSPYRRHSLVARAFERVRDFSARECAARTASLLREIAEGWSRQRHPVRPPHTDLLVSTPA